jgi:hypothetical protein
MQAKGPRKLAFNPNKLHVIKPSACELLPIISELQGTRKKILAAKWLTAQFGPQRDVDNLRRIRSIEGHGTRLGRYLWSDDR